MTCATRSTPPTCRYAYALRPFVTHAVQFSRTCVSLAVWLAVAGPPLRRQVLSYHVSGTQSTSFCWNFVPVDVRQLAVALCRLAIESTIASWQDTMLAQKAFSVKGIFKTSYERRRMCGNKITSRIEGESVSNMVSRSSPIPNPPAGGMPYSNARM